MEGEWDGEAQDRAARKRFLKYWGRRKSLLPRRQTSCNLPRQLFLGRDLRSDSKVWQGGGETHGFRSQPGTQLHQGWGRTEAGGAGGTRQSPSTGEKPLGCPQPLAGAAGFGSGENLVLPAPVVWQLLAQPGSDITLAQTSRETKPVGCRSQPLPGNGAGGSVGPGQMPHSAHSCPPLPPTHAAVCGGGQGHAGRASPSSLRSQAQCPHACSRVPPRSQAGHPQHPKCAHRASPNSQAGCPRGPGAPGRASPAPQAPGAPDRESLSTPISQAGHPQHPKCACRVSPAP